MRKFLTSLTRHIMMIHSKFWRDVLHQLFNIIQSFSDNMHVRNACKYYHKIINIRPWNPTRPTSKTHSKQINCVLYCETYLQLSCLVQLQWTISHVARSCSSSFWTLIFWVYYLWNALNSNRSPPFLINHRVG